MKQRLSVLKPIIGNENTTKKIIVFFVALFFLSDFLTKILIVYDDTSFNRLAGVAKLIFEFVMLFFILKKGKINQPIILGSILLMAFLISKLGYVIIDNQTVDYSVIVNNIYYLNRYLYIFIFIAYIKLYEVRFSGKDDFIELFKTVLYVNSVLIIIGFLFKIELFKSYSLTARFGYDGIFSKHGEAAYYYMFFISVLYYEYFLNRTMKKLILLVAVCLISTLLGKKANFLFLFLLLMTHFVFIKRKAKEVGVVLLLLLAVAVSFWGTISNLFFEIAPFWQTVYQKHGLMATLTSIRSDFLIKFFEYVSSNWNLLNYLFGMGDYETFKIEFELVDLFMFFGFVGVIVFGYLFKKYFYKKGHALSTYLLLSILITSFFSGALFISVTGMMFFYIVFQWINTPEVTPI